MAQRSYLAAVEVCVWRAGKILVVWGKFTCPGGKIDEGEDPDVAAARELKEETGLVATTLKRIAGNVHKPMKHDPQKLGWFCLAYEASVGDQEPRQVEEGTTPFWATPEELKTKILFPDYYTWLFEVVGYEENFFGQPRFVHGPLV